MKKLALAIGLLIFGATVVPASVNAQETVAVAEEQKVEVAMEDLPEAVQTGFTNSEFKDLQVEKIYQVVDEETQATHYLFELKDGEEKIEAKFDDEGNPIQDKE
jgi:hypothetical protein